MSSCRDHRKRTWIRDGSSGQRPAVWVTAPHVDDARPFRPRDLGRLLADIASASGRGQGGDGVPQVLQPALQRRVPAVVESRARSAHKLRLRYPSGSGHGERLNGLYWIAGTRCRLVGSRYLVRRTLSSRAIQSLLAHRAGSPSSLPMADVAPSAKARLARGLVCCRPSPSG